RFPACVLAVELPHETVDVNVHPAKIEVRFINEKPVFDAVYYGVRSTLESRSDFKRVLFEEEKPTRPSVTYSTPTPSKPAVAAPPVTPAPVPARSPIVPKQEPRVAKSYLDLIVDEDRPRDAVLHDAAVEVRKMIPPAPVSQQPIVPEPTTEVIEVVAETIAEPAVQTVMVEEPAIFLVGELFSTYILAQMGESVFIIDKHAAHERILYNQLKAQAKTDTQPLLTPVSVTVSRDEHSALLEAEQELKEAGIEIEDFGGQSVLVRSFPLILAGTDIDATLREIAVGLAGGSREIRTAKLDWIYHSSACRAAVKAGDISHESELLELAKQVLLAEEIRTCPHGRPVCVELTRKELEKQFGRIV
ncbi:MAG: hypothetical protein IIW40_05290, partial [Clostridia bacterium]|nr:hypothetical protein [Clostridia bacterium]